MLGLIHKRLGKSIWMPYVRIIINSLLINHNIIKVCALDRRPPHARFSPKKNLQESWKPSPQYLSVSLFQKNMAGVKY